MRFPTKKVIFLTALLLTGPLSPQPSDVKSQVLSEIKAMAKRHVKSQATMQSLAILEAFKNNPANLSSRIILEAYETEYISLKQNQPVPKNKWYLGPGWITAFAVAIFSLFGHSLKNWITLGFDSLGKLVYKWFSGYIFFRSIAIRRYKDNLIQDHETLRLPFRPERPLDLKKIFVPLHVRGSTDEQSTRADEILRDRRKIILLGDPGAGKSLLLKRLALDYAMNNLTFPDKPVPVLLELHRLSNSAKSIEEELVDVFTRSNFPKSEKFVSENLRKGKLMLMLDGYDEISTGMREKIKQDLNDFLKTYRECRFIITCRRAVYNGEFAELAEQKLEISDFNNRQINIFLRSWQEFMPPEKSPEHLLKTLANSPQIKNLAGNPLLLTIISYLYSDTDFIIPNSRTEFYGESTGILLGRWHKEHNGYRTRDKHSVLQHLSLLQYTQSLKNGTNIATIPYQVALSEIKELLPSLDLNPQTDARPILNEIVERSGLLIDVGHDEGFQFAHLTLQEYFAAIKISSSEQLLNYWRIDNPQWREIVKMYCGQQEDCTLILKEIFQQDNLLAIECLAEAQKVDPDLAMEIIDSFILKFNSINENISALQALGAIAADRKGRGDKLFTFLKLNLEADIEPIQRLNSAIALAFTFSPYAAKVIGNEYVRFGDPHSPLIIMGDIAVPQLDTLADAGHVKAIAELAFIGTFPATNIIVSKIWNDDNVAVAAAWSLADLLQEPSIEEYLRHYSLSAIQKKSTQYEWVWQPFRAEEPNDSSLPVIAGRITYLIQKNWPISNETLPRYNIDQRIALPILTFDSPELPDTAYIKSEIKDCMKTIPIDSSIWNSDKDIFWQNMVVWFMPKKSFTKFSRLGEYLSDRKNVLDKIISALSCHKITRRILSGLELERRTRLIMTLIMSNVEWPNREDWSNVSNHVNYAAHKTWYHRILTILVLVSTSPALIFIYMNWSNSFWDFVSSGIVVMAAVAQILELLKKTDFMPFSQHIFRIFGICGLIVVMLWPDQRPLKPEKFPMPETNKLRLLLLFLLLLGLVAIPIFVGPPIAIYYSVQFYFSIFNSYLISILIMIVVYSFQTLLAWKITRIKYMSENPFHLLYVNEDERNHFRSLDFLAHLFSTTENRNELANQLRRFFNRGMD